MRTLFVVSCALSTLILAGCGSTIATTQLEPPAAALMVTPKDLPEPKAGDDLVQISVTDRREYATVSGKLKRLQRYVRVVLGKR